MHQNNKNTQYTEKKKQTNYVKKCLNPSEEDLP